MSEPPVSRSSESALPALHGLDPTGRFTSRASDYARFRPTYPGAAVDAMLAGLGDPSRLDAADVGAGTGISSRLLADRGVRVVAVEPNAAMRDAAEPHPLVRWQAGTAEATGLPPASLDLVLCAQAFHWFRADDALAELARVLRPGRRVALLWNEKDPDDPFTAEFAAAIALAAGDDPAASAHVRSEALFRSRLFRGAREERFAHVQPLDEEGLVGRALSASYVPKEGPARERLVATLRALAARREGRGDLVYRVRLYLAESASR
jgi:SAM-dependent methyltransferase